MIPQAAAGGASVLEGILVCQLFNMNNSFTTGLQLEMGLWGGGSKPTI